MVVLAASMFHKIHSGHDKEKSHLTNIFKWATTENSSTHLHMPTLISHIKNKWKSSIDFSQAVQLFIGRVNVSLLFTCIVLQNKLLQYAQPAAYLDSMPVGDGVDERVKVEGWKVRVLCLDEHHIGGVVPATHISTMSLSTCKASWQLHTRKILHL